MAPTTPIYIDMPSTVQRTFRNLRVRQNVPGTSPILITYSLYVNGAATVLAATLAANAGSGNDLVNSVAVNPGDRITIEVTKASAIPSGMDPNQITVTVEAA
jgi:hypothetical protein